MKSVLISIQPYWVFLIIAKKLGWNIKQEKTIEVRKSHPKDVNWDKVAKIYCSQDKKSFSRIPKEYQPLMKQFLGKGIGEFVCDEIKTERPKSLYASHKTVINCCVPIQEIIDYVGEKNFLYFWHISNLVIYDKPRELNDFYVPVKDYWETYDPSKYINGCWQKPLTRPPQSWMYVEEVKE